MIPDRHLDSPDADATHPDRAESAWQKADHDAKIEANRAEDWARAGLELSECKAALEAERAAHAALRAGIAALEVSVRLAAAEPERMYSTAGWRQLLYMAGKELRALLGGDS